MTLQEQAEERAKELYEESWNPINSSGAMKKAPVFTYEEMIDFASDLYLDCYQQNKVEELKDFKSSVWTQWCNSSIQHFDSWIHDIINRDREEVTAKSIDHVCSSKDDNLNDPSLTIKHKDQQLDKLREALKEAISFMSMHSMYESEVSEFKKAIKETE